MQTPINTFINIMQNKIYNTQNIPEIDQDPYFLNLLRDFDLRLQNTINCDLRKHELQMDLTDDEGLTYCIHFFYIHSEDGKVLIHRILEETELFWDCNGIDSYATGAQFPDGSLVQDNTVIIKLISYA